MARTRSGWRSSMSSRRSSATSRRTSLVPVSKRQVDQNQSRVIQRLVKLTKGIAPELKIFDTAISMTNVTDTGGSIQTITEVGQSDVLGGRTANKIRIKHIYLQVRVSAAAASLGTTPTADEFTRILLVQDMQQIADTAPTVSQIVVNTAAPQNPIMNSDFQGRFRIKWRSPLIYNSKIVSASTQAALTVPLAPTQNSVWYYSKRVDIVVTYNGSAGTDIQKNGLYVVVMTNVAADTTDVDGYARIKYIDD